MKKTMKFMMLALVAGGTMFAQARGAVGFGRFGQPGYGGDEANCVQQERPVDRHDLDRGRTVDRDDHRRDDHERNDRARDNNGRDLRR